MFKRKSVLFTWIFSYLIMIALLSTTVFLLKHTAQTRLLDEYKAVIESSHSRTSADIVSYFQELERSAYEISQNAVVEGFVGIHQPDGTKYYDLTLIQRLLSTYKFHVMENTSQYLYMNNIQKALSDESIYRLEDMQSQLNCEAMDPLEFAALLSRHHYNEIVVCKDGTDTPTVLRLTSIPFLQQTPRGMLIQVLDQNVLAGILQANLALENSTNLLLNQDDSIICCEGNEDPVSALQSQKLSLEDQEVEIDGENYWIQQETIGDTGWTLLTVIPMAAIGEKTTWVQESFLPIFLMALVLSMTSGMCFLYLNYQPLRKLHKAVLGNENRSFKNEYVQLGLAFDTMQSSIQNMRQLQLEQTRKVNRELLISCVEHDVSYEGLANIIDRLGIRLAGEWFGILVAESSEPMEECNAPEHHSAMERALEEKEIPFCLEWLPMGSQMVVLLNGPSEEELRQLLEIAEEQTRQRLTQTPDLLFASGRPCRGYGNIHLAYLEACELLSYRSSKRIRSNEAVSATALPRFSVEQENLLLRYLEAGNVSDADGMMELLIRNNLAQQDMSVTMARCLAIDILSGIIRRIAPMESVWQGQAELLEKDLYQLRYLKDKEEFARVLQDTVHRVATVCGACSDQKGTLSGQNIDRIIQCVEAHFREPDFNVSRAAAYLDMNSAYLSSYFKSQTGVGLLSYITSLRINFAKKCMDEDGLTVGQASKEAGFDNVNTFIRNFKRYEGISPGVYSSGSKV